MSYSVEVNILCDAQLTRTGINRCCGYVSGEPMEDEEEARASAWGHARARGWRLEKIYCICPACLRVKQLGKTQEQEPAA